MTAIPAKVLRAVQERSGGVCEGCGRRPAMEMHHRQYRSRGGRHEVVNLLHLCGSGNHTGCHGTAHTAMGAEAGWSVHSWATPAEVPVNYRLAGLALLTENVTDEHRGVKRIIHTRKEH